MTRKRKRKRRRKRPSPHGPSPEKVAKISQPLWTLPPYEIASEERLQLIHDKSMQILEEGGIAFYYDEAIQILQAHNVKVVDQVAYFDREQVMEYLAKAPSQFVWAGRNPEQNVIIGGDHVVFAPVAGPPFVRDMENGRRDGTLKDLNNFIKLSQTIPYLHSLGAETVVPADIPIEYRHLETMYSLLAYGDKPVMGIYHTGPISADAVQMAKIVHGEETLRQQHMLHGIVNVSSPRRLDDRMLSFLIEYARHNQIINITPFILSGAMGPVSILGTVAQLNAEALAGIVFTQMVNPGNPCVYGSFQAILDLQSGAPVFGAPESQLALYLSGQLARMYNLPFRAAGAYASSKIIDAQGAYESMMAMLPSLFVRPNFVLHAAGWLE
ncbi:Trimethylamine methyltransferase family protein, partial [hydrothermal vent metagenome]